MSFAFYRDTDALIPMKLFLLFHTCESRVNSLLGTVIRPFGDEIPAALNLI